MAHDPHLILQEVSKILNGRAIKKRVLWDQDEDQRSFIAFLSNKLGAHQMMRNYLNPFYSCQFLKSEV